MSNCSEDAAIGLLLDGIARECSVLGGAIAQIGDEISGEMEGLDTAPLIAKFQAFDMLSQNAHAQARLLAHLTRLLHAGTATTPQDLLLLLDDMPIHDVRHRLRGLLGAEAEADPGDEAEIW